MKRFHFPLRPVAIVRANREIRAREALAVALRAVSLAEERLEMAQSRAKNLEGVISQGRRVRVRAADEVAALQSYRRECAGVIDSERQLAAARVEAAKRRQACVEANREVKVVATLEDKARSAYRADCLRAEQQQIDEIAGFRTYKTREAL
jgi:flagellar FliJ protein